MKSSPLTTHYEIGSRQMLTLPDGTTLPTVFRGYLSDVSDLPLHGSQIGDMYRVGPNLWVLSTIPNTSRLGWENPPPGNQAPDSVEADEQSAGRRALPVDTVVVRRAKKVVPRAELVKLPDY